ncbi:carbohydrate ABC transporter permease [Martelella sp. HB161492]|uniref:carbohydrate ABC transporter permease n=1 Tax=Martelella sp. HB161492 TaxID=2720726 RepID=UPI001590F2E4|nr:carbohydrate ABC transporter permease [Martelella sp. HB161492]
MPNGFSTLRGQLLLIGFALLACAFALVPILWGVVTALKPTSQVLSYPPSWWPDPVTFQHFVSVWTQSAFPRFFLNSIIVTGTSSVLALVIATHAAYGLARFDFAGKTALMIGILATSMIPGIAILVPLYNLAIHTGLYNTYFAMVLVYTAWEIPLLLWLLKGFFEKVPVELEEAALVDGASRLRAFYLIALPMARPGLLAGGILNMVFVWNDFLIGFTLTLDDAHRPLPVGLYSFISNIGIDWGPLMAATVMAIVPILVAFLLLQRFLVEGLMAGAVKG